MNEFSVSLLTAMPSFLFHGHVSNAPRSGVLYIFCFIITLSSSFPSSLPPLSSSHSTILPSLISSFSSFFLVFFPPYLLYFILTHFLPFIMFLFPLFTSHNAKQRIASGTVNGTACDVTFLMSRCKISDRTPCMCTVT